MPTNKRPKNRELTRTLAGQGLNTRLLTLNSDRMLPLAPRSLISVPLPPLASYIRQQISYFTEKGSRLARWVTDHTGLTLLRASRLPILQPAFIPILGKPPTLSPVWQRLLEFTWFRRRRKQRSESPPAVNVTDEERLISDVSLWADKPYPNEHMQTVRATEEEVNETDELYPMVIENLLSTPAAMVGLPDISYGLSHQHYANSVPLWTELVTDKPEAEDIGGSTLPHISPVKIPSIYQAEQIQRPDHQRVRARANWQPQHTYPSRSLDQAWSPLTQELAPYRVPITRPYHITHQNIPWAQTTPVRHYSYLTAMKARVASARPAAQQPSLPYIGNIPEVVASDEEFVQTVENYYQAVEWEKRNNLPYSLPDQSEPAGFRTVLKKFRQPTISKTSSSFPEPWFNPLTLNKEPALDLLSTRPTLRRVPEISQTRWSVPPASLLPQIVGQRAKTTHVLEDSGGMTYSRVPTSLAATANVNLGQRFPTGQTEMPLLHRESPSIAGLPRRPSLAPESIDRTPASPFDKYFKSVGDPSLPDGRENYSFLRQRGKESSSPRDITRQPALELLLTSVAGPGTGSKATDSGGSLSAILEGTAYYGSQSTPELALAPAGPAETVPPPPKRQTKIEEMTKETTAPDIDTIARDVYSILKRRLTRERERALGLS